MRFFLVAFFLLTNCVVANKLSCDVDISEFSENTKYIQQSIRFINIFPENSVRLSFKGAEYGVRIAGEAQPKKLKYTFMNLEPLKVYLFEGLDSSNKPIKFRMIMYTGTAEAYEESMLQDHRDFINFTLPEDELSGAETESVHSEDEGDEL